MKPVQKSSEWVYHGVWAVLVSWFKVPQEPPVLPALSGEVIQSFRPASGFLRYLKFQFWVVLVLIDVMLLGLWIGISIPFPWFGLLITPLALAVIVLPDIVAYVAIHLRFDTTWYVMSDRSLRIRRGIWSLQETTITFENIQNVTVDQGPLQRYFGISDVLVQTAGGGGSVSGNHHSSGSSGGHNGLLEGVHNAPEIRDLILSRLKQSKSSGVDEDPRVSAPQPGQLSSSHVAMLREIRDAARALTRA